MNGHEDAIAALVAALPEVYQPIYGYPELSGGASRATEDRLGEIVRIYKELERRLGRPLRVLDLGCAQGYISLSLASLGASVVGVEMLPENVALCRGLASQNPELKADFVEDRIEQFTLSLVPDSFDLVLLLSVIHHVAFHVSPEVAGATMMRARQAALVLLAELALADEPMYWSGALPADPTTAFEPAAFVREICRTGTHLSQIERPLYFVSDTCWYAASGIDFFEQVKRGGHRFAKRSFGASRTYYISSNRILKVLSIQGEDAEINLREVDGEAAFLMDSATGGGYPRLIGFEKCNGNAYLLREKIAGEMLIDIIDSGRDFDYHIVIRDILVECIELESRGLYHQDVRVWNVLRRNDGQYCLIDFGAISVSKNDCFWPQNIYIAFLVFVKDLLSAPSILVTPIREISVTPYGFQGHLSYWVAMLAKEPLSSWSFELMLAKLEASFLDPGAYTVEPQNANEVLLKALEEAVSALARSHNGLAGIMESSDRAVVERIEHETQRTSNLHNDLLGLSSDYRQLSASVEAQATRLPALCREVEDQAAALSALNKGVEGQAVVLSVLSGRIEEQSVTLSALNKGMEEHVVMLSVLDGGIDGQKKQMTELLQWSKSANERLEELMAVATASCENFQLLQSAVNTLSESLDAIAAGVIDLGVQVREVAAENQAKHDDLANELSLLKARIFRKGFWMRLFTR